jgi:tRNA threonylcarbamoyladenosine biosynthesis protein TsaB
MIVLGIDCSTKVTAVGVSSDGKVLAERNTELGRRQSSELPLIVNSIIKEVGLTLNDITLMAAGIGPGYYTGIRTGIAYAASLASALSLKVVPLHTTELLVHDLTYLKKTLAPVIKARANSIYCALYSSDGIALTTMMQPSFMKAADFTEIVEKYKDAVVVGSDVSLYDEFQSLKNKIVKRKSGGGGAASLMGEIFSSRAVMPMELRGLYLRAPDIGPQPK